MATPTTSPLVTFRRLTGCALIALAAQAAVAQTAPPEDAPAAQQSADPPGRVARLNYMAGTVTTEPAGASDWSYASVNRPLTTGDQLWNDANARSELHIGSTAVRLGSSTNLDILNLDDTNAQLKVAQGTLSTRVRALPSGSSYEIDTPNVALGVTQPGDYRIDVAPDGSTTTVTVRRGALTAYGDSGQVPLAAGEQITFTGSNLDEAQSNGAPPPDAFDQWAASRDATADRSVSARYVSRDIPGYEDLDANGTWSTDPEYGAIWVPHAEPAGWAPYHEGHWAWIAPWGWTWVDDAPWGFAPYHYGRWAYVRSSWCWVPGPLIVSAPPVYAPALVAFVGGGDGGFNWSVGLSIGGAAAPGVAWFPLGPREVWHPREGGWSPRYYERVNQTVIVNQNVNITNIHNTYVNYHAPGAVTAVPADAFVHGRPVAHFAQKVDPRQWRNAQINPGGPGIAPVRESFASGLRPATYHPPQSLTARQVVATRAPGEPAAYHDRLAQRFAQSGGQVPGAGQPVVRMRAPAGEAAQQAHEAPGAQRFVRVVDLHSPVVAPAHGPAQAAGRVAPNVPNAPNAPNAPNGARPELGQAAPHAPMAVQPPQTNGVPRPPVMGNSNGAADVARHEPAWTQPHVPMTQQHATPGDVPPGREAQPRVAPNAPNGARPEFGQAAPHAPMVVQPQTNGVPHPPVMGNSNGAADVARHEPAWTQPHVPMTQQHATPGGMPPGGEAQPAPRQAGNVPQGVQPQPTFESRQAPRAQPQPQPQPRMAPPPQPQVEARPQPQPQPQPHIEARPQPQPRMAPPPPQPHFEARPQPQPQPQPQPHIEARPQPQPRMAPPPQPHIEARPQPQPQPQPQPRADPRQPQALHSSASHEARHQG